MDEFFNNAKVKYRLQEFEDCLANIERTVADTLQARQIPNARDNINYLLETLGKSILTTREVITLCYSGFPDGALALSRNLYEQFVVTVFIEDRAETLEFETLLEKYYKDYYVKSLRIDKDLFPEREQEINTELNGVKEEYGINGKLRDYWWCGKNTFHDLEKEIQSKHANMSNLLFNLRVAYKQACVELHASFIGNTTRVGGSSNAIDMGPWLSGQEFALYTCSVSLIGVVAFTYNALELDDKLMVHTLNDLSYLYHEMVKENHNQ